MLGRTELGISKAPAVAACRKCHTAIRTGSEISAARLGMLKLKPQRIEEARRGYRDFEFAGLLILVQPRRQVARIGAGCPPSHTFPHLHCFEEQCQYVLLWEA